MRGHEDPAAVRALYRALEPTDNTSYVLSADLRIVRANTAWERFARANGGDERLAHGARGSDVLDAASPLLRPFLRDLFERGLATGEVVEHDYECSSPDLYRACRMIAIPVAATFLVVTHSVRLETAHDRTPHAADDGRYLHGGVIRMCAGCRRVQAAAATERWDWVPAYLRPMPATVSHGLCPACAPTFSPSGR